MAFLSFNTKVRPSIRGSYYFLANLKCNYISSGKRHLFHTITANRSSFTNNEEYSWCRSIESIRDREEYIKENFDDIRSNLYFRLVFLSWIRFFIYTQPIMEYSKVVPELTAQISLVSIGEEKNAYDTSEAGKIFDLALQELITGRFVGVGFLFFRLIDFLFTWATVVFLFVQLQILSLLVVVVGCHMHWPQ